MEAVLFVVVLYAIPVLLGGFATTCLALVLRVLRSHAATPWWLYVVVGTASPLLMIGWGQYLAWPWPWWQPEVLRDGFPPGPLLIVAAWPAWALCLWISRHILAR